MKSRNRDMWKNIPWERRAEIAKQVKKMPESRERIILELAFIDGLSTVDIAERAKTDFRLWSRNHRPLSVRRIQQIIAKEIPDYNVYQKRGRSELHKDQHRFALNHQKERCAICNSAERLEWHHMIPAFLGGTADESNMICLCHGCHQAVTEYHRKLFPEHFGMAQKVG